MVLKQQMVFPGDKGLQSFASAEHWRFNICIVKFKRRAPGGAEGWWLARLCLAGGPQQDQDPPQHPAQGTFTRLYGPN